MNSRIRRAAQARAHSDKVARECAQDARRRGMTDEQHFDGIESGAGCMEVHQYTAPGADPAAADRVRLTLQARCSVLAQAFDSMLNFRRKAGRAVIGALCGVAVGAFLANFAIAAGAQPAPSGLDPLLADFLAWGALGVLLGALLGAGLFYLARLAAPEVWRRRAESFLGHGARVSLDPRLDGFQIEAEGTVPGRRPTLTPPQSGGLEN